MPKKDYPKLRNCPFCGGEAALDPHKGVYFVQCEDCDATFPFFDSLDEAVSAWNRRAEKEESHE